MTTNHDKVIRSVQNWVESFVVELNLCPFARDVLADNRVRFTVTAAATEEHLLTALQVELELLNRDPSIETTLLIHPGVLQAFYDYNQFLDSADQLLLQMKLEGIYQLASFHPDYQFGGTDPDDVENYTNRSPYPVLQLLREASLERALAGFPDADQIPARNIALMNSLGKEKLDVLTQVCSSGEESK